VAFKKRNLNWLSLPLREWDEIQPHDVPEFRNLKQIATPGLISRQFVSDLRWQANAAGVREDSKTTHFLLHSFINSGFDPGRLVRP
jgi:hypothetical protein